MFRFLMGPATALALCLLAAGCGGGSSSSSTTSSSATSAAAAAPAGNPDLHLFSTEAEAQSKCPDDSIVWLNPVSGIYHEKGTHLYGHTKRGDYVCRKAADAAGDRDAKS